MTNNNLSDLRDKVIKGINLSYERLLASKIKENGELVISKNGKIIRIKASELLKKL